MTHASQDDPSAEAPSFAAVMRERTKIVHREAERSGFIADLIRGRATRRGYATFLRNLVPVYAALEAALAARRNSPLLAAFAAPSLRRLASLQRDLSALVGPDEAAALPLVEAARAYATAIDDVAADPRLMAHAYARYLGDLSGGQILKPLLGRTLGLGPEALSFYDFPDIVDLGAPKIAMREALDRVPAAEAEPIVAEAIAAFRHNIALSEAVQAALA